MSNKSVSGIGFSDTKKHYQILDGLRGVAAIIVVMFHILETFSGGDHSKQIINHGYLAVDFFFMLSGFVIGYAYDDRWGKMTLGNFFKRRIIRLHPMIIIGMVIGALTFYFQEGSYFPLIEGTPVWKMLLVMVIGFTLIPISPSMDIRGWSEMHPLDGPAWSLFFEYIGNILYALFIRKLSNKLLAVLVFLAGAALIHLAVTSPSGDIIGGWSLNSEQLYIGFTRLLFPFFAGLLISRMVKPGKINNAFLWSSLILTIVLSLPRVGNHEQLWINGLYDSLSIILLFPFVVYIGASGNLKGKNTIKISRFLGDISYPLYITHYAFMYMLMAWFSNNQQFINEAPNGKLTLVLVSIGSLVASIILAYACFTLYDVPVRKWLTKKYLPKSA